MAPVISRFAQITSDYSYSTSSSSSSVSTGTALGLLFFIFIAIIVLYLFYSICYYKLFKKAGHKDAWAGFVPIYQNYVLYEIVGRPGWWVFLSFIPIVNIIGLVFMIITTLDLAKSFGKSTGYGVFLILLPFIAYPMLAFGSSTYQGPAADGQAGGPVGTGPTPPPAGPMPAPPVTPPTPPPAAPPSPPIVQ